MFMITIQFHINLLVEVSSNLFTKGGIATTSGEDRVEKETNIYFYLKLNTRSCKFSKIEILHYNFLLALHT